jgi:hypothetical protein
MSQPQDDETPAFNQEDDLLDVLEKQPVASYFKQFTYEAKPLRLDRSMQSNNRITLLGP